MLPVGRFAPSPTGLLHFGSLVTAVASYLATRSLGGRWLVRMEDLDPPRIQAGASDHILHTLITYGFEWDGVVLYQSHPTRQAAYAQALKQLKPLTYPCYCSRKQLQLTATQGKWGSIYNDTCRHALPQSHPCALRIRTPDQIIGFDDHVYGHFSQQLHHEVGDFVLKRADGFIAYQLAVVVDDAFQGVNQIVRGADLLDNTPRQLYLQQLMGYPTPDYAHIPLVLAANGQKLSKQTLAPALSQATDIVLSNLLKAWCFLGQQLPPDAEFLTPRMFWDWAIHQWHLQKITTSPSFTAIRSIESS